MPEEGCVLERLRRFARKYRHDPPPPIAEPLDHVSSQSEQETETLLWPGVILLLLCAVLLMGAIRIMPLWPPTPTPAPTQGVTMVVPTSTVAPSPAPTAPPPPINLRPLVPYQDPQGHFALARPERWEPVPKPPKVVIFRPQDASGFILINRSESRRLLELAEATKTRDDYVRANFGEIQGFTIRESQDPGQPVAPLVFNYDMVNTDNVAIRTIRGMAWIDQSTDSIAIMVIAVPDDQYDALAETIAEIRASYQLR